MLSFVSCPQRLHLQGRSWTVVVGNSLMSLPFPHTGQIAHPSFVTIVADLVVGCKAVSSFSGALVVILSHVSRAEIISLFLFPLPPSGVGVARIGYILIEQIPGTDTVSKPIRVFLSERLVVHCSRWSRQCHTVA